jgi:hypothetical protein
MRFYFMRKLLILAFASAAVVSQAIVIPIPFFTTAPALRSNFDSMSPGSYTSFPVFSGNGLAVALGPGSLLVGPPFLSAPNGMSGFNADVLIRVNIPMRRFGGRFRNVVLSTGVAATAATFKFFDASGTPLGTQTVPLTATWTWHGFFTNPKWVVVQIFGNIPGFQGGVVMDNLRIRPN